jgi:two-component system response regulator WspF
VRNGELGGVSIIAIGASAGGPAAVAQVLAGLPSDLPAAVVVVQHLDASFASDLAEWLSRESSLSVRMAKEWDRPEPGMVLLAATNDHLELRAAERLGYTPHPEDLAYRPSVDVFFNSVTARWPGKAIGVLLTGMGRDGAQGLQALRNKGHHTIAQDEATSLIYGMPKAATVLGAAIDVLPIERIAPRLVELCRTRPSIRSDTHGR